MGCVTDPAGVPWASPAPCARAAPRKWETGRWQSRAVGGNAPGPIPGTAAAATGTVLWAVPGPHAWVLVEERGPWVSPVLSP